MQNAFFVALLSVFVVIVLLSVFVLTVYNEVHYSKYKKLMSHLQAHHNDVYEQIRIKPSLGPLYAQGAFRKSIIYARNHPPINDTVAEELLSDFADFSQISPTIIRNAMDAVFQQKADLGYNKLHLFSGIMVGMVIGPIIGGVIGTTGLPNYEGIGLFYGAIVGLLGGIVGGYFGAVREFGWKMAPFFRSTIGAILGSLGWVIVFTFLRSWLL